MCGVSLEILDAVVLVRALSEGSPFVFDFCLSVRTHRESVYLWKVVCTVIPRWSGADTEDQHYNGEKKKRNLAKYPHVGIGREREMHA